MRLLLARSQLMLVCGTLEEAAATLSTVDDAVIEGRATDCFSERHAQLLQAQLKTLTAYAQLMRSKRTSAARKVLSQAGCT